MRTGKLAGVETARVLAATVVLVQHGVLLTLDRHTAHYGYASWLGPASGMAVNLFFVISGYLLVPPLLGTVPDYRRFLLRRFRRLAPLYYAVGGFMVVLLLVASSGAPVEQTVSHLTFTSIYDGQFLVGTGWTLCVEIAFAFMLIPISIAIRSLTSRPSTQIRWLVLIGLAAAGFGDLVRHFLANGDGTLKLAPVTGLLPLLLGGAAALGPKITLDSVYRRVGLLGLLLLWPLSAHVADAALANMLASIASTAALVWLVPTTWSISAIGRFSYGLYLWQLPLVDLAFYALFGELHGTHTPAWGPMAAAGFTCCLMAATLALSVLTYRWVEAPFLSPRNRALVEDAARLGS